MLDKEKYFKDRLEKAKNPKHKAYYRTLLSGGNTKGKYLYSETLDRTFSSLNEFADYVGYSRQHINAVLRGQRTNKYLIRYI